LCHSSVNVPFTFSHALFNAKNAHKPLLLTRDPDIYQRSLCSPLQLEAVHAVIADRWMQHQTPGIRNKFHNESRACLHSLVCCRKPSLHRSRLARYCTGPNAESASYHPTATALCLPQNKCDGGDLLPVEFLPVLCRCCSLGEARSHAPFMDIPHQRAYLRHLRVVLRIFTRVCAAANKIECAG